MKSITATCSIALSFFLAAVAYARSPSLPPELPANFGEWTKHADEQCILRNRTALSLQVYDMNAETKHIRRLYMIKKNGALVHQMVDRINIFTRERTADAFVKLPDGNWEHYNWMTEEIAAGIAIERIAGIPQNEFRKCLLDARVAKK